MSLVIFIAGVLLGMLLLVVSSVLSFRMGHRKGAVEISNYVHAEQLKALDQIKGLKDIISNNSPGDLN